MCTDGASVAFLSWSHLDIGQYAHKPFTSDSSSFAAQVLSEELPQTEFEAGLIFWEPSTANSCWSSRARVAQLISTIRDHTHDALLSPCQKQPTTNNNNTLPMVSRLGRGGGAQHRCARREKLGTSPGGLPWHSVPGWLPPANILVQGCV